jgi:hypothetical protein
VPSHEFGIINNIDKNKDYSDYCPQNYNCISIDDDIILSFIGKLDIMQTYYHNINRPDYGLAYYGVTLIPPSSLDYFQDVLLNEKGNKHSSELNQLITLITIAIGENKYLIHYGI